MLARDPLRSGPFLEVDHLIDLEFSSSRFPMKIGESGLHLRKARKWVTDKTSKQVSHFFTTYFLPRLLVDF